MSKEIIDELKLIGQYFDVSNLDVYEQKHHIRFTSIIKDRINFYINKSDKKQLTLTDVVVPKGTLCCPECKSTDLKVAIHTDYNECNKCYHYWET